MNLSQKSHIVAVGFDADDTLWHSEHFYQEMGKRFIEIVQRYVDCSPEADQRRFEEALYAAEIRNLSLFGYGAKGLTLSMLETALEVTESRIDAAGIQEILTMGKELLNHPIKLLPGVEQALTELQGSYRLLLITKGDLFHQETKIAQAQVAPFFERVEIVSEKDRVTYERILRSSSISPETFVMVGNSLRSDIEPVLELGGWGIHIPYEVTWAHETQTNGDTSSERLQTLSSISEVAFALREIGNRVRAQLSAFAPVTRNASNMNENF